MINSIISILFDELMGLTIRIVQTKGSATGTAAIMIERHVRISVSVSPVKNCLLAIPKIEVS
jgi:hypothetical protein